MWSVTVTYCSPSKLLLPWWYSFQRVIHRLGDSDRTNGVTQACLSVQDARRGRRVIRRVHVCGCFPRLQNIFIYGEEPSPAWHLLALWGNQLPVFRVLVLPVARDRRQVPSRNRAAVCKERESQPTWRESWVNLWRYRTYSWIQENYFRCLSRDMIQSTAHLVVSEWKELRFAHMSELSAMRLL
jgi:hypothetical protein